MSFLASNKGITVKNQFDGTFESLGHKFIVELEGPILTSSERENLKKLSPIGFCPFAKNFLGHHEATSFSYDRWLKAFATLIKDFKQCTGRDEIIVAIDHEGGRVVRPPAPITRFPYAFHWASRVDDVAQAMALELRSLGVNITFAPVCDIHTNPDNPVIGERAFGTDPASVTRAASQFAKIMSSKGIVPCAKHFPGHGDVNVDTHEGLATLGLSEEQLLQRELAPFEALIREGIPMIMSAHILFPAIDKLNPATLSVPILKGMLRDKLGFKGVVVSDALGMEAIRSRFETSEAMRLSVEAQCDLYIVAHRVGLEWAIQRAEAIIELVKSGALSADLLDHSSKRIEKLLGLLARSDCSKLDDSVFEAHALLARSLYE